MDENDRYEQGMQARRAVLGDAYVDRALAKKDSFNEEFERLITRYAWGEAWTRPVLSRHTRSLVTVAALVALNQENYIHVHVRGAINNGVTREEIKELLMVYCGVPAANNAFRIAKEVFAEMDAGR